MASSQQQFAFRWILLILSALSSLLGIALVIVALVFLQYSPVIWIILVLGLCFVVNSVFVFVATFCPPTHGCSITFFNITSIFTFILIFACFVLTIASIFSQGVLYIVLGSEKGFDHLRDITKEECDSPDFDCLTSVMDKIQSYTSFAPWFAGGGGVLMIFILLSVFGYKGKEFFSSFSMNLVSVLTFLVAGLLLATGLLGLLEISYGKSQLFNWSFVTFMAIGGLMLILAILGIISFFAKKNALHIINIVFTVLVFLVLLAFAVLSLVMIVPVTDAIVKDNTVRAVFVKAFTLLRDWKEGERDRYLTALVRGILKLASALGFSFTVIQLFTIIASALKIYQIYRIKRIEKIRTAHNMFELNFDGNTNFESSIQYASLLYGEGSGARGADF